MIHVVFEKLDTGVRTRTMFNSQEALHDFYAGGYVEKANEKVIYAGEDETHAASLIEETLHRAIAHHLQSQMDLIRSSDLPAEEKFDMGMSVLFGHRARLPAM